MKIKHFEYIIIYFSVLIVCVLIGVIGRLIFMEKGADEYTGNVIFWICTGGGILIFAILSLFLHELTNRIFKNKKGKLSDEKNLNGNFEKIREQQKNLIINKKQTKIEIVIHYTQKQFALYTTNDDLKLLCDYIIMYVEDMEFENIKPIAIKDLSSLDIYHFGWNIWNHFKVSKQERIAQFLKKVFADNLRDVDVKTIKTHLKDDEQKGIIKITDLSG